MWNGGDYARVAGSSSGRRDAEPDAAVTFGHFVRLDGVDGRAVFHGARNRIELGAVPGTLHGPAGHHAVGERSAFVRAAVVEGDVAAFDPGENHAVRSDAEQLHLVDLEVIHRSNINLPGV